MSYRPRPDFDQPTAETIQRSRRALVWIIPFVVVQQGLIMLGHSGSTAEEVFRTFA
jgi:hypothetical protein